MTPNEINRAIAESVGWRFLVEDGGGWWLIDSAGNPRRPFTEDLNAIQEAVETLEDQCAFLRELQIVTQEWTHVDENGDDMWLWYSVNATAPQRCEAYLRTMNLWRDQ